MNRPLAAGLAAVLPAVLLAVAAVAAPPPPLTPPPPGQRPSAAELFTRLDTDGDGFIRPADVEALRGQAFDRADANADGYVDAEEGANLRDLAEGEGGQRGLRRRNPGAQGPGLERYDTDADGRVSRAEWIGREIAILRLDTDGDGAVSEAELQTMQGRPRER